ncbi:MAG: acyl-CoA dehydrogenase family protein [Dehalococcoidia bacterium]
MNTELQPTTEAGRKFVALAEEHAADFATRADQHDREGSFPHENIDALQASGYLAGPIPEEFGGMGVRSQLDLGIAMSRLARGCASTAISANMHLVAANVIGRILLWPNQGNPATTAAAEGLGRAIGAKQLIACAPATEAGTYIGSPMTEAMPVDGGYSITGRKMFATLSPAANLMFVALRVKNGDGYVNALAIVPKATPGVTVLDNWDAMGMRASGSHDVTFEDVRVPAASLIPGGPWGSLNGAGADMTISFNFSLPVCFLGIAEAARALAVELAMRPKGPKGKRLADRIAIQELIAEIEIDLAVARAIVERTGHQMEAYFEQFAPGQAPEQESFALLKEQQCMKYVLQRKAIDIVDRAMTATGGSAYMAQSPFSRLYRDARAGPFMQPYAPHEALEYIGKVTLGLDPNLDR